MDFIPIRQTHFPFGIKPGVVVSRGSSTYLIVSSGQIKFPRHEAPLIRAYGLVNLSDFSYISLDISDEALADLLRKARLEIIADNLDTYSKLVNGEE